MVYKKWNIKMIKLSVPINVVAKERARKGKFGYYTPTQTRQCMNDLSWAFKKFMSGKKIITENIKVGFNIFTVSKKGDLSNFIKLVEDAGNKILWQDDKQIKSYSESWLNLDSSEPLLILTIEKIKQ